MRTYVQIGWIWLLSSAFLPARGQLNSGAMIGQVQVNLKTENLTYAYTAKGMQSRFNPQLKRFEFLMPLSSLQPASKQASLSLVNTAFAINNSSDSVGVLQLFVYLPTDTRNFEDFRVTKTVSLPSECRLADNFYKLPASMSLFYNNSNVLLYTLALDITSNLWPIAVANKGSVPLQAVQIYILDGRMEGLLAE